jgi:lipopolysaccharide transport system permease protein
LFTMLILSLFFGKLAKVPSDRIPYPLFCLAGLVPWTFFANGFSQASSSLVTSSNLISKVYFPRLSLPISAVMSGAVDFLISSVLLVGMMIYYHQNLTFRCLSLPLFFLLAFVSALGISLWLSALNVEYRDVRYAIPFLSQLWMFATPIAYPSSLLHQPWRAVYGLNPMAGVVEGFRWALIGADSAPGPVIVASSCAAVSLLIGGAFYFRRMEKIFADVV